MSSLLLLLHLLLFLQLTSADFDEKPLQAYTRSLKVKLSDLKDDSANPYSSISIVSRNKPTLVTIEPRTDESAYKADAVISRLDLDGTKQRCSFPALRRQYDEIEMLAYSSEDVTEVLLVTAWPDDSEPSTELFVVNMTDCEYEANSLAMAFSDVPREGMGFVIVQPWEPLKFEIFTFDGRRECGAYICRRIYDIESGIMSRPRKFLWLDDEVSPSKRTVYSFGALSNGKYAGLQTRRPHKASLSYLSERGELLNYTAFELMQARFIEMSTLYNNIRICYDRMYKRNELFCETLNPRKSPPFEPRKSNFELGYRIESMAIRNLPRDNKFLLLTLGCEVDNKCDKYTIKLYIVDDDVGKMKLSQTIDTDDSCMPKTEFYPTMYREGDKICVYYQCVVSELPASILRTKCFEIDEL